MDHTALIWTLAITLAVLCMLLAVDFIFSWRNNCRKAKAMKRNAERREREAILRMCTEDNKLGSCAEPVEILRCAQNDTEKCNAVDGIDLCGRERPVFEVKLPPNGKVLHLLTPTKAVSDRFQAIGVLLERQEQHRLSMDGVEQLFKFAAILLSNNKECYVFTPADLTERLTSEDIGLLLQSYLVWLTETIKSLN